MASKLSLEHLLEQLLHSTEEDNQAVLRSALVLLQEIAQTYRNSSLPEIQNISREIVHILDTMMAAPPTKPGPESGDAVFEFEEEFVESGEFTIGEVDKIWQEKLATTMPTGANDLPVLPTAQTQIPVVQEEQEQAISSSTATHLPSSEMPAVPPPVADIAAVKAAVSPKPPEMAIVSPPSPEKAGDERKMAADASSQPASGEPLGPEEPSDVEEPSADAVVEASEEATIQVSGPTTEFGESPSSETSLTAPAHEFEDTYMGEIGEIPHPVFSPKVIVEVPQVTVTQQIANIPGPSIGEPVSDSEISLPTVVEEIPAAPTTTVLSGSHHELEAAADDYVPKVIENPAKPSVPPKSPTREIPKPVAAKPYSELVEAIDKWNSKAFPWLQIALPFTASSQELMIGLMRAAATVRSNLASGAALTKSHKEEMKRFNKYWNLWQEMIVAQGYEVVPGLFGKLDSPIGRVIYSCQPNLKTPENVLILPGLKKKDSQESVLSPISLVSLPPDVSFPDDHPDRDLAPKWRAILGELALLLEHLELQTSVGCAIESVNKTAIEPLPKCRPAVIAEITRRGDALRTAIRKRENIYRLATNYWRVEECFWAVFHDDERQRGYSFFDRLRKRVQAWRPILREEEKLLLRDFMAGRDCLASVDKYIGNIILHHKPGVAAGIVLRELRPALVVKVNNASRLLKGRVIAT